MRARLEQAPEWFRRSHDTLKAGALAEEVKRLCTKASCCSEPAEVETLLAKARSRLDEMQALLGSH